MFVDKSRYIVFAKMFWSTQDPDPTKRKNPDPNAFKPDPKTGEVDVSARSRQFAPRAPTGADAPLISATPSSRRSA
jgi:hypothetical protein